MMNWQTRFSLLKRPKMAWQGDFPANYQQVSAVLGNDGRGLAVRAICLSKTSGQCCGVDGEEAIARANGT